MESQDKENILQEQQKPIKVLVVSGGGAKGGELSGALEALQESGVADGVTMVAGSSAGSIMAAAMALGVSAKEYYEISKNTDLKNILGKSKSSVGRILPIHKDGKPLYDLVNGTIKKSVSRIMEKEIAGEKNIIDNINKYCLKQQKRYSQLLLDPNCSEQEKERITLLQKNLQEIIDEKGAPVMGILERARDPGSKIRFKDLGILNTILPEKFKDLTITGVNQKTGELEFFNSNTTPEADIAMTCKASASIPLITKPTKVNGQKYVDGGVRNNIPLSFFDKDAFHKDQDDNPELAKNKHTLKDAIENGRTVAMVFSNNKKGDAYKALYTSKKRIVSVNFLKRFLIRLFLLIGLGRAATKFTYDKEEEKTYQHVRKNSHNIIGLNPKNIGTLDFKKAGQKFELLHLQGSIDTQIYLDNHDLCPPDPSLPIRSTLLKACFKSNTQEKEMLAYCKKDLWQNKSKEDVVKHLISCAAKNKNSYTKTKLINNLSTMLNKKSANLEVKKTFAQALGKDISTMDIAKYKFESKDWNEFIKKDASKYSGPPQVNSQLNSNTPKAPKSFQERMLAEREQKDNSLTHSANSSENNHARRKRADSATERLAELRNTESLNKKAER